MSSKYEELIKYVKQTEALSHASGLIAWDQETKMPKGSVEQRADTLSVLESEIHKRKSNKYIEELISHIKKDDLSKIKPKTLSLSSIFKSLFLKFCAISRIWKTLQLNDPSLIKNFY